MLKRRKVSWKYCYCWGGGGYFEGVEVNMLQNPELCVCVCVACGAGSLE